MSMDNVRRRIINCNSEAELNTVFLEIYENALRSRDYYNGALRKLGQNPYNSSTQEWGSESGTSFDMFMKKVAEIKEEARDALMLGKSI